jgi:hypothetical protein
MSGPQTKKPSNDGFFAFAGSAPVSNGATCLISRGQN